MATNTEVNGFEFRKKYERIKKGGTPRILDIFCGCGGFSLGFKKAGYKIISGIEIDKNAGETFALNLLEDVYEPELSVRLKTRDITKIKPQEFLEEVFKTKDPSNLIDVIIGGPPCQAFARIGRAKLREILENQNAFLDDARANLYVNFLEYVELLRPLVVVLENVPDLMNFGRTNIAHEICVSLDALGYESAYTILNAAHYGVPQARLRVFIIAYLKNFDTCPTFPIPSNYLAESSGYKQVRNVALKMLKKDLFNLQEKSYYSGHPKASDCLPHAVTVKEAIHDLPIIKEHLRGEMKRGTRKFDRLVKYRKTNNLSDYARSMREWGGNDNTKGISDHVIRFLPRDSQIFKHMKPGSEYPQAYLLANNQFEEELEKIKNVTGKTISSDENLYYQIKKIFVPPYDTKKFPNKWWKLIPDEPSRTLTSHIGKDTYSHIHFDSEQARVISVREAARLQSFPDDFIFAGAMNSAFHQIGNAVPPLLSHKIAIHIKEELGFNDSS